MQITQLCTCSHTFLWTGIEQNGVRLANRQSVFALIICVVVVLLLLVALVKLPETTAAERATNYLVSSYDSRVGLVVATPNANVSWLYSDNYVVMLALRQAGQSNLTLASVADNISGKISVYTQELGGFENQYMVLGNNWSGPCVFNSTKPYTITRANGIEINVTLNNGTGTLSESQYADIAFLKAICLQDQGHHEQAIHQFNLGASFFDGKGFRDLPFNETGQYQTFKLALYIYASKVLSQPVNQLAVTILLKMQAPDGGFYTGYDPSLSHDDTETNAETTGLAILALSM